MVPRVRQTTPYQRPQIQTTNGDVPPSSIAAQLADNIAITHQDSSTQDRQNFQSLIREILEGNDHIWQADGSTSSNAVVSSRLICVIVQAGLNVPTSRSSTDQSQGRSLDVIKSLQAIDLTLSRSPAALFQPLDFDSASGFPLFAWLVPKVLVEIGDWKFNDIERLVLNLVQRSFSIAERATTRLRRTSRILGYLRGYIKGTLLCPALNLLLQTADFNEDLLYSIETWDIGKNGSYRPIYPPTPTSETIKEVFPEHCENVDGICSAQMTPRSASHAFIIVFVLLSGSVLPLDTLHRLPHDRRLALLESTLYDLERTWIALNASGYSASRLRGDCLGVLLPCLRSLLQTLLNVASKSIILFKATCLLYQILSVALGDGSLASNSSLESEICLILDDFSKLALNSIDAPQPFSKHLLQILSQASRSQERSPTLTKALQVGVSLAILISLILMAFSACYHFSGQ